MALQAIADVLRSIGKEISDTVASSKYSRFIHYIGLAVLIGLFGLLGTKVYRWHTARRDAAAQYAFSTAMEHYMLAQHSAKSENWADVAAEFKMGYERHASSSLAPFFLAYQAQALLQQDKKQEALDVLGVMLAGMSSTDPLYAMYSTQRALIMLDSNDSAQSAQGFSDLVANAHDQKNRLRDQALYFLGLYYAAHNELEKARQEWNLLIQSFPPQGQVGSVYAELAQAKIDQL